MRVALLLFLVLTPGIVLSGPKYAWTDSNNTVVAISEEATPYATGLSSTAISDFEFKKTAALFQDDNGRRIWGLSGATIVPLDKPLFPANSVHRQQEQKHIVELLEPLNRQFVELSSWQSNPALSAVKDRSGELSDVVAKIAKLCEASAELSK